MSENVTRLMNTVLTHSLIVPAIPQMPTLTVSPSDTTLESGTNVTFTCLTQCAGTATYHFMKGGIEEASQQSGTYTVTVATTHAGSWTCTVTINTVVSSASTATTITVVGM